MDYEFLINFENVQYEISQLPKNFTFNDFIQRIEITVMDLPSVYQLQDQDNSIVKSLAELEDCIEKNNIFLHIVEVDLSKITDPSILNDFIINSTMKESKRSYQQFVTKQYNLERICEELLYEHNNQESSLSSIFLKPESELTVGQIVMWYKQDFQKSKEKNKLDQQKRLEEFDLTVDRLKEKLRLYTEEFFAQKKGEIQVQKLKMLEIVLGKRNRVQLEQVIKVNPNQPIEKLIEIAQILIIN